MKFNFLTKLIKNLSQEVFRPVPTGILYSFLQAFSREISGECPWDTGADCYKGFSQFWFLKCRNMSCPGYRHPTGVIAYTSRSASAIGGAPSFVRTTGDEGEYLSVDNRFDYSSFRYLSSVPQTTGLPYGDDWIPVGTNGAYVNFNFGVVPDTGGFGAGYFGANYFGYGTITVSGIDVQIGDRWYIECLPGQLVGPASPDPANKGIYGPIVSQGLFTGDHKTVYTVQIIDFWGYVQNFENALLQINLATCSEEWLDYWGEYFGIKSLFTNIGWENDSVYRARIMKEITRAKGTKPVLLEEAVNYFKDPDVRIIEYQKPPINPGYAQPWTAKPGSSAMSLVDTSANFVTAGIKAGLEVLNITTGKRTYVVSVAPTVLTLSSFSGFSSGDEYSIIGSMDIYNPGGDPDDPDDLRFGLWPYQFYIYPPVIKKPSAKWVKTGSNLMVDAGNSSSSEAQVWKIQSPYYAPYPPPPQELQLTNVSAIDEACDLMFIAPAEVRDTVVFGSKYLFGGLKIVLESSIIKYEEGVPPPLVPPVYYWSGGKKYEDRIPTDGGVGGTYIWEYWNGTGWTIIKVSDSTIATGPASYDTPNISLEQDGFISWKVPVDWAKADSIPDNIPNTGTLMYWIRCRIVTAPTTIANADYIGIIYAGSTARGCYNGTQVLGYSIENQPVVVAGSAYDGSDIFLVDTTMNFVEEGVVLGDVVIDITDQSYSIITSITTTVNLHDTLNFASLSGGSSFELGKLYGITSYMSAIVPTLPPFSIYDTIPTGGGVSTTVRDSNNIYVYFGASWERPDWQGLQDIIDRLKTAGTIAIINPRFGG